MRLTMFRSKMNRFVNILFIKFIQFERVQIRWLRFKLIFLMLNSLFMLYSLFILYIFILTAYYFSLIFFIQQTQYSSNAYLCWSTENRRLHQRIAHLFKYEAQCSFAVLIYDMIHNAVIIEFSTQSDRIFAVDSLITSHVRTVVRD